MTYAPASACQTLPDCHGSYLPGSQVAVAFDLSRSHEIGAGGLALAGSERADIHKLHRIGAVLASVVILIAAIMALRTGLVITAAAAIVIVILEFAVGITAVLADIPISLAVAHNWLAAMLLLGLLRLLALNKRQEALAE